MEVGRRPSAWLGDLLSRWRNRKVLPYLGRSVLDLGCGRATILEYLPREVLYTGVDRDPRHIEKLRRKRPGHDFRASDLDHGFPELEHDYDTVLLLAVLEHLRNPRAVLERCQERLRPGGKIVITLPTPFGERVHRVLAALRLVNPEVSHAHLWRFDASSLDGMFDGMDGEIVIHRLFQLGCNRLLVYRKSCSTGQEGRDGR